MERNKKRIAILLATYNGGKYLKEQIDSIIKQTYADWSLYVRDDGSEDDTISIIGSYCKLDSRIHLLEDNEKHVGAAKSFMRLLERVDSELYMFCDQDDVWKVDKIKITIEAYDNINVEKSQIPIVVHTDVTVTDEHLNIIVESQWKDANIYPDKLKSYDYIVLCTYTQGNTMLINQSAKVVSFPLSNDIGMHDLWIASRVLKRGGCIESIYSPTLYYRQHGDNVMGVRTGKQNNIISRLLSIRDVYKGNKEIYMRLRAEDHETLLRYIYYKIKLLWHMHVENHYK